MNINRFDTQTKIAEGQNGAHVQVIQTSPLLLSILSSRKQRNRIRIPVQTSPLPQEALKSDTVGFQIPTHQAIKRIAHLTETRVLTYAQSGIHARQQWLLVRICSKD